MSFDLSDYIDVPQRIADAKALYPDFSLQPANVLEPYRIIEIGGMTYIAYTAAAYRSPDDVMPGIGCAWEQVPGTTPYTKGSELMNAETSAWGRAIIALGLPSKKIASKEEVQQAKARREADPWETPNPSASGLVSDRDEALAQECIHGEMKYWEPTGKPALGAYYCKLSKDDPEKCAKRPA